MPTKVPYHVLHVSGQDELFKASELNTHSPTTKGWQSTRFCLYPQDIVIQMDHSTRLRKIQILSHQYLIATKIEFYIGDVADGHANSLQNARYTRLGYVALSDNEKTGYKARELKSVHVDAVGIFVKFVIHKNHINKHNLYNQVGIIAINLIGDTLDDNQAYSEAFQDLKDNIEDESNPHPSRKNRLDYISPLDDLAFDMYQDPEVAQIIRRLEHNKQAAVIDEKYDFANKLKSAIHDLQKVGEKLGKFEVEKRQAVEGEDYERAKLKKVQMDEYRLQVYQQLQVYRLLERTSTGKSNKAQDPAGGAYPGRGEVSPLPDTGRRTSPGPAPSPTPYDERPLPAIKHKPPEDNVADGNDARTPRDERPLPAHSERRPLDVPEDQDGDGPDGDPGDAAGGPGNVTGEPEALSEKDQREAAIIIDTFGLPLAAKSYSKTWSFREDALLEVYKQMSGPPPAADTRDDLKATIRAAVFLINRATRDKVFAVYTAGLNLLKMILTEFIPQNKIGKNDTIYLIEKTLPNLLQKSGDTAPRNRDSAKKFILEESNFPEAKSTHVVPVECVRPFKLSLAPRLALSRTEILDALYKQHGLDNSGLSVESVMRFCVEALRHTAGEVREQAERIIIHLYRDGHHTVKQHLPHDDERTRKNVLYKQLFEAFDKIDGKPSKEELKKKNKETELAKQKEIEDLQQQLQQLKDITSGKSTDPKEKKSTGGKNDSAADPKKDDQAFQIDHTCIFCGEKNAQFTEEGLDLHYWKSCPMLKRCSHCKQVVEIAGLAEHLLTECEAKDKFKKCARCSEAIIDTEYDAHTADNTCPPFEAGKEHCPLCHQNISRGEDAWKDHLMGPKGCKQNLRRLQANSKQGKGQPAPAKSKSKVPVRGGTNAKTARK